MPNVLLAAGLITLLLAALRIQGAAVSWRSIAATTSRKFAHIALGTALVLTWLLYQTSPAARWLAAAVPAALALSFVALGVGTWQSDAVVLAGSRSGYRREFLLGPVYYAAAFAVLTVMFWRTSPVGMSALMVMVVGDGLGEIAGRSVRSPRIPWNAEKSVAGSIAVFVGGWVGAALAVWVFTSAGYVPGTWTGYLVPLVGVAAVGTVVETLPLRELDNITVPAASALAGYLMLGA